MYPTELHVEKFWSVKSKSQQERSNVMYGVGSWCWCYSSFRVHQKLQSHLWCKFMMFLISLKVFHLFYEKLSSGYIWIQSISQVPSKDRMDIIHLYCMKSALQDLQSSFETTEENIERYINTMKFDAPPKLESALTQWPAGSNPSYNPKQRNEVEINNGWIRSIIFFK